MSTNTLRKTLLAIAISAATSPAFAVIAPPLNADVSGTSWPGYELGNYSSVTLSGYATRLPGNDGVIFFGTNVIGDLTNNANITANGPLATGLGFASSIDGSTVTPTTIGGDLVNNANMSITGAGSAGISAGGLIVGGSVINNSAISVTGITDPSIDLPPQALYLYNSHVAGDLTNNGTINATGKDAQGVAVESSNGATGNSRSNIGGSVNNKGTININGENALGLSLSNVNLGHDIVNQGNILASGKNANGIVLDRTAFNSLNNTGNIAASGENAVAIRVANSESTNGIVNTGVIASTGTAINIDNSGVPGAADVIIHQNGGAISGGDASINGNHQAQLQWTGGVITGDMKGMKLVQISGNGTFNGSQIDALLVDVKTNTLYMAADASRITGDLAVQNGGSLQVRLRDVTSTTTPIVTVNGKASFAAGSKIGVTATPGDFTDASAGKTYVLVKAGSIENSGLTVVSNSALINISGFKVDGQTVTATVKGLNGSEAGDEIVKHGATSNAVNAMTPFTDSVLSKLSANDIVFQAFTSANGADLAKLAEQLAPVVNGGTTQAAVTGQSMISSALSGRSEQIRGQSSGDVLTETGVWMKGLYSDADQSDRNGVAGYNAYTGGFILGADGKLNAETTVGVAFSHLDTTVNSESSNTDVSSNLLTAYGSWARGPIFVDASVTYGKADNDSKRQVASTTAKGDYDSDMLGLNVLGGYTFNLDHGVLVEPRAALRYTDLKIDGYTEKGSSAALSVGSQRLQVGEAGAGVRVAKDFPVGNGTLKPQATLMAYHDFIGDKSNSTSTFTLGGNPFVTSGATQARDSYELGLGMDYSIGAVTVGASYTYLDKTDFRADTFAAKIRYDF
ncbi:autotransporter outer membrane beta-barrel domain-containing protein [Pseudomonas sp. NPDC089569]|uniref:autotransporter family protein n=1 Tax=Pseudomonas sp. NPDC089569 TaxID=3390722 RepID=UPI003D04723F